MNITKNKKFLFGLSAVLFSCYSNAVFADMIFGPKVMICKNNNDINSCHCQTDGADVPGWYPIIVEESHVYKGVYAFHSVNIYENTDNGNTQTDTLVKYTNPHAGDILKCRYKGNTLMPYNLTAGYWLSDKDDNIINYYCGTFNYGTSRASCPMFDKLNNTKK